MKYLRFDSVELANARNAEEALRRGCNPDNTKYWWTVAVNEDGTADLQVGSDMEGLTETEFSQLTDSELAIILDEGN